jgi:Tfp pilus assembly protein PilX
LERLNITTIIILAVVVVLIAIAVIAFFYFQRRRSENLRKQFGPEYERAVDQYGGERKAEAELAEREKRVRKLDIRGASGNNLLSIGPFSSLSWMPPSSLYWTVT